MKKETIYLDKGKKKYKKAVNEYIRIFGTDEDIIEYSSTWEYDDNDFERLAGEIEDCIRKRKNIKIYMFLFGKNYIIKQYIKFLSIILMTYNTNYMFDGAD